MSKRRDQSDVRDANENADDEYDDEDFEYDHEDGEYGEESGEYEEEAEEYEDAQEEGEPAAVDEDATRLDPRRARRWAKTDPSIEGSRIREPTKPVQRSAASQSALRGRRERAAAQDRSLSETVERERLPRARKAAPPLGKRSGSPKVRTDPSPRDRAEYEGAIGLLIAAWEAAPRFGKGAVIAGATILAIVLVGLALFAFSSRGIPPEALATFFKQLEANELDDAEATLEDIAAQLPPELATSMQSQLQGHRAGEIKDTFRQAAELFKRKKYGAAGEHALTILALAPDDLGARILVAESLRLAGDLEAAAPHYQEFINHTGPKDKRYDDAVFWRAEALVQSGDFDQARQLFAHVTDISGSNFRRSAARRLKEIAE